MLVTLVLSFVAMFLVVKASLQSHRTNVMPPFSHLVGAELWDSVDGVPDEGLPAALADYGERLNADVHLAPVDDPTFTDVIHQRVSGGQVAWSPTRDGVMLYLPLPEQRGVAVVGPVEGLFEPHPGDLAVLLGLVLVLVVGAASLSLWPIVRRLQRLERAATAIGDGDLDTRVPGTQADAIGERIEAGGIRQSATSTPWPGRSRPCWAATTSWSRPWPTRSAPPSPGSPSAWR